MGDSALVGRDRGVEYRIYFNDHPRPHFTAIAEEGRFRYSIETIECIDKRQPPKGLDIRVRKWAYPRQQELLEAWTRQTEPNLPQREPKHPMPEARKQRRLRKRKRYRKA